MPPRLVIGAILLFWLAMTGWLIHREVVPLMLAEVSPTFQIDLTDEIGSPLVGWVIKLNSKRIGSGTSKIYANGDHTYEFRSSMHFDEFKFGPVQLRNMEGMYRVTEEGKLQSLYAKFEVNQLIVGIRGDVVADSMEPIVFMGDYEKKLDRIVLPQQGSVINPMHPVNRLRGLRRGQIWKVTLLDPLGGVHHPLVSEIAKQGMTKSSLIAEVKHGILAWDRKEVPCYKIEYYEPGKEEIAARTWARRSDGLVLQQEANLFGQDLISERVPN